jgi:hypothetical protein
VDFLVDLYRVPVDLAQFGKRGSGTTCLTPSRKQHRTPPSGAKSVSIGRFRMTVRLQLRASCGQSAYQIPSKIENKRFQTIKIYRDG